MMLDYVDIYNVYLREGGEGNYLWYKTLCYDTSYTKRLLGGEVNTTNDEWYIYDCELRKSVVMEGVKPIDYTTTKG